MAVFLDTNVLIYYLTRIDEPKAKRCLALLQQLERREIDLVATDVVILETAWVLESRTELSREEARDLLMPIVSLPSLRMQNKQLWQRAFDLYCDERIDFVDAYNAAWMERNDVAEVYSYDKDFDRVESITRREP